MEQKEFSDTPILKLPNASVSSESTSSWYLINPGIWERLLNGSGDNRSVLQWWEPGAKSPTDDIITHTYIEEVIFMDGSLKDVTIGLEWGKGAYAYRFPGMKHGPYVAGEKGCYQFVKCVPMAE